MAHGLTDIPPLEEFTEELHPQPEDPSTFTGYVSVADIEDVFERVRTLLVNHSTVISGLADQIDVLESRIDSLEIPNAQ